MTRIAFSIDQGPRENIEDAGKALTITVFVSHQLEVIVMVICDGVGGEMCGELASKVAIEQILAFVAATLAAMSEVEGQALTSETICSVLTQAFELANQAILQEASVSPDRKGMATTAVCAVIVGNMLHMAWLGDSRCYLHRNGILQQLTHDHSEAQELIDAGVCTAEEAKYSPCSHVINRCLGQSRPLDVPTLCCPLAANDAVVLNTDGLTDVLTDEQISDIIQAHLSTRRPLESVSKQLVASALRAGTQDNVSVMICHYQPGSRHAHTASDRTQTGAYPVRRAQTLRQLHKELINADTTQYRLFA